MSFWKSLSTLAVSCILMLEWRRLLRLATVGPRDRENEVVGLEGAIIIRGGWMVLSECRRPGRCACTRSKFESGLEAAEVSDVRRTTSSMLIDVRRDSSRSVGGRGGPLFACNLALCSCICSLFSNKNKTKTKMLNLKLKLHLIYGEFPLTVLALCPPARPSR